MKTLTLWQPWASLIAVGAKTIETRSWRPPASLIGERVAIHAGMRLVGYRDLPPDVTDSIRKDLGEYWETALPRGAVVATARLLGAYLVKGCSRGYAYCDDPVTGGPVKLKEDLYGDFSVGRWLWMFAYEQLVKPPVPARGRQGLWDWTLPA